MRANLSPNSSPFLPNHHWPLSSTWSSALRSRWSHWGHFGQSPLWAGAPPSIASFSSAFIAALWWDWRTMSAPKRNLFVGMEQPCYEWPMNRTISCLFAWLCLSLPISHAQTDTYPIVHNLLLIPNYEYVDTMG